MALAVAGIAALSGAAYLWISTMTTQAMALSLVGLAALLGAGPFLFGWSARSLAAPAGTTCHSCGFVPAAETPTLGFCMMCGNFPKGIGTRYH